MRLLHTSDWHLGRNLHGADLTPAFEAWADHVVDLVATQDVDALIVAGDVYDRAIPPVPMVDLLADTLERALEYTRVIVTSGNHDSAQRLGFGARLMREGLYFYTDARYSHVPVPIPDSTGHTGALIYPIPYLDPHIERTRLADDPDEPLASSHRAVVGKVLENISADLAQRSGSGSRPAGIITAHTFVSGAKETDSERNIAIGGIADVPASLFNVPGVDYVALGHIHGPQSVGGALGADDQHGPLMRYCGSPIPFSFSEENHVKSSVLLDTEAADPIELIEAPVFRKLATLEGTLEELLSAKFAEFEDHFVRIHVTDPERPRNLSARLAQRFEHVLEIQHVTERTAMPLAELQAIRAEPLSVLREFFESAGGRPLTDRELELIRTTWESIR